MGGTLHPDILFSMNSITARTPVVKIPHLGRTSVTAHDVMMRTLNSCMQILEPGGCYGMSK